MRSLLFTLGALATTVLGCHNPSGMQIAVYHNFNGPNSGTDYAVFDPTVFKDKTPDGTTHQIFIGASHINRIVSNYGTDPANFTMNYRGYILPKTTGQYKFIMRNIDDIALVWIGDYAYSGWTRDNANLVEYYDSDAQTKGAGVLKINLVAGTYYPFRFMFANSGGPFSLNVNLYDPNNAVIWGRAPTVLGTISQYGCGNNPNAPEYPPFGQET